MIAWTTGRARLGRMLLGCAAALAGIALSGLAVPAGAAEPIKLGAFLAVSGPASFLGDPEKKTLELYVERINAEGGVLGRKLALTVYDTVGDAKQAATFARRLIEEDKVDAIIGGSTTGDTMAAVPLVERAGLPFISLGGAAIITDPVKKWVFKTPHNDRMAAGKNFADMKKRGIAKLGLIGGDGGFDKSCMHEAEDAKLQAEYGVSIVAKETFSSGDRDVTAQLTKLKSAPGLQAVYFCGFGAESVLVTRNFRQLAIPVPLYHTQGSGSIQFIKGAGEAAEGVRLPAGAILVADQLPASDPQRAPGVAYIEAYKARYHEDVSIFGGHAYDALMLMVSAIKRAGSTGKEKVRAALEATKNYIGVDGIYNMSPQDHLGLDLASFKMVEVKNGAFKYLY
jgi:branched-chain amino acid transport system substrate-binding protein